MTTEAIPVQVEVSLDAIEREYAVNVDATEETYNLEMKETLGTGGTNDYTRLKNKPSINSNELIGDKTFEQLGLVSLTNEQIENLLR